ncbi:hypothetical protein SAMN06295885_0818 [Rathayibacter oskolensis]|uniref:Uncharacterized protein n=1 Tax=Rathayibacter oskolensis TaxID=1891671 RepID=A0A1X7N8L4_9MICO|nr:hypothetical protein [Rathayibacter oskolensis]SMH33038.1 hypothetical protein SAMN06295885_0818 [Rathayibacter oskolensis]
MNAERRWTALPIAEGFDDEDPDERGELSTLPSSSSGLILGLALIAGLSWICTAALVGVAAPRATVLLVAAALLALLLAPGALRAGAGSIEIPRRTAALLYGGSALLGFLGWSTLLWAPEETWAAMAAAGVLQTGCTLGVALTALQSRLAGAYDD